MGRLKYLRNVATLKLNAEKCTGCGMCVDVCPHGVFEIRDRKAGITDLDLCMECGACALNCARGAIEVKAGVGCAAAVISGALKGTEPTCGCCSEAGSPKKPCC
ncbi:MAG TPA: mercury methylation ferredoxin HgcB [bacterium]|nr:mercury methylation ferredoxin HgcB [bacterium]